MAIHCVENKQHQVSPKRNLHDEYESVADGQLLMPAAADEHRKPQDPWPAQDHPVGL